MSPHIRSHRAPCSCFPKKAPLQLSSEQSVGDVGITQLDWKRVPQARSRGCKSSVAVTAERSRHQGSHRCGRLANNIEYLEYVNRADTSGHTHVSATVPLGPLQWGLGSQSNTWFPCPPPSLQYLQRPQRLQSAQKFQPTLMHIG